MNTTIILVETSNKPRRAEILKNKIIGIRKKLEEIPILLIIMVIFIQFAMTAIIYTAYRDSYYSYYHRNLTLSVVNISTFAFVALLIFIIATEARSKRIIGDRANKTLLYLSISLLLIGLLFSFIMLIRV